VFASMGASGAYGCYEYAVVCANMRVPRELAGVGPVAADVAGLKPGPGADSGKTARAHVVRSCSHTHTTDRRGSRVALYVGVNSNNLLIDNDASSAWRVVTACCTSTRIHASDAMKTWWAGSGRAEPPSFSARMWRG
jgi:hypothetical protein